MNNASVQEAIELFQKVEGLLSQVKNPKEREAAIYRKRILIQKLNSELDREIASTELKKLQSGSTSTLRKRLRKLHEKKTLLINLLT